MVFWALRNRTDGRQVCSLWLCKCATEKKGINCSHCPLGQEIWDCKGELGLESEDTTSSGSCDIQCMGMPREVMKDVLVTSVLGSVYSLSTRGWTWWPSSPPTSWLYTLQSAPPPCSLKSHLATKRRRAHNTFSQIWRSVEQLQRKPCSARVPWGSRALPLPRDVHMAAFWSLRYG